MRQSVKIQNKQKPKSNNNARKRAKKVRKSITTQNVPSAITSAFNPFMDSIPYNRKGIPGVRVRGSEYLTTLQSTPPDGLGTALYTIVLNPSNWTGTRIQQMSRLYEKYSINALKFKFLTSTPTTVAGSMVGGFDYDVTDSLVAANDQGVRQLMVSPGSCWHSVWQNAEYLFKGPDDQQFWLERSEGTGSDRLTTPGRFISVLAAGIASGTVTLGGLIIEYDINMHIPQYETFVPSPYVQITTMKNDSSTSSGNSYGVTATGASTISGQIYCVELFQRSVAGVTAAINAGSRYYAIASNTAGALIALYNSLDGVIASLPADTVKAAGVVAANTLLANYCRLTSVSTGGFSS